MPEIEDSQWFTAISYVLAMIPAFIYVVEKGKFNFKVGEPSVPLDKTNIGNNNAFILFVIFFLSWYCYYSPRVESNSTYEYN